LAPPMGIEPMILP